MQFSTLFSVALSFAAVIYAQTSGQNSITYPLGGTLDSSEPITIRWTPSSSGTVTLQLLKGPPTNIISVAVIAASIDNSGSFTWTIPSTLQDSRSMPSGDKYGFKIIDDSTNNFEYSPPFDISVTGSTFAVASASKSVSTSATATKSTSATATKSTSATATKSTPEVSSTSAESTTTAERMTTSQNTAVTSSESTSLSSTIVAELTTTTTLGAAAATTFVTITSATAVKATGTTESSHNSTTPGVKKGLNIILIIGIASGAAVFLGVVIATILICKYKNRRK